MTYLLAILTGVAITVLAQIGIRYILDPIQAYKLTRASISFDLDFHAAIWSNPGIAKQQLIEEAQIKFRAAAMQLRTQPRLILFYRVVARFAKFPDIKDVNNASRLLIGLSNSLHRGDGLSNGERVDEILNLLGLPKRID